MNWMVLMRPIRVKQPVLPRLNPVSNDKVVCTESKSYHVATGYWKVVVHIACQIWIIAFC